MALGKAILVVGGAAFAVAMIIATNHDATWRQQLAHAQDPAQIVALMLHEDRAASSVERIGSRLVVKYSLAPWALTAGTMRSIFRGQVVDIVPELFRRFPDVDWIEMCATARFRDLRGNEREDDAMRVAFSRANATTVQWAKIDRANVPRIADRTWTHPSFND